MLNIAIISPAKDAISETFIRAHRDLLKGNIHYLYGGNLPTQVDGKKLGEHVISDKLMQVLPAFIHKRVRRTASMAVEDYLKANNIHVVLAEYGPAGAAVYNICQRLSIPLVVHFHGYDASKKSLLEYYLPAYRQMFNYAAAIICVSQKMKETLINLGVAQEKLHYNVYGPQPDFYLLKPDFDNGHFISVGRFVEKKAPYLTLMAFKKLLETKPNARLVMIGAGPMLPVCKALAGSLNIANIMFTGALEHAAILPYLSKARCFVQHSVTAADGDEEGTPVAILEAGAAGLPVIATKHGGIPDVVLHDKSGFLVNEFDVDAMAAYMERIMNDKALAKRMGETARMNIAENFSLEKHIDKLDELIKSSMHTRA